MTLSIAPLSPAEVAEPRDDAGLGSLRTERGNLPLDVLDARADITGLVYRLNLVQEFVNVHEQPLEATYVFPLPDRAAVTAMRMTADGRTVEAKLEERGQARETYDRAIAAGQRASIAEEERPDVFTMRVGNIVPGERVRIELVLAGPLPYADGAAEFRLPLVVAPRYIPGAAIADAPAGDGYAPDTDAVPDASRITPPVLLPGFPNPVRLSVDVGIDPAGLPLPDGGVRSSLHAVSTEDGRVRIQPGERVDRDFVLRLAYGSIEAVPALTVTPDADGAEGTFQITVLPPTGAAPPRPRDVVLLLDRSGSMGGWKMVAARRAAARIVDTLTGADRFAVLTFDHGVERPDGLPAGLVEASDRNRFRAVEHLAGVDARGGTEMLEPLMDAAALLRAGDAERDRVLVLVTDGQVGNEDQILRELGDLAGLRVHTVGIDRAVNAGFLNRLAAAGGGRAELVESEDRLDEVMDHIHRRIGTPLVTGVSLVTAGLPVVAGTVAPDRIPDLFPGVPLVVRGRYRGRPGAVRLSGRTAEGRPWHATVEAQEREAPGLAAIWARAHLRDLEDRYAVGHAGSDLEKTIVDTSLRFSVLCRFTAYVAVDSRVVAEGGTPQRVVQPVEAPSGWDMFGGQPVLAAYRAPEGMAGGRRRMRSTGGGGTLSAMAAPSGPPHTSGGRGAPPRPEAAPMAAPMSGSPMVPPMEPPVTPPDGPVSPFSPPPPVSVPPAVTRQVPQPPVIPPPVTVRPLAEQARGYLDAVREARTGSEAAQWARLGGLATWLRSVLGMVAPDLHQPVQQLLVDIDAATLPPGDLLDRAEDVLRRMTGGAQPPRRAFWKR